VKLKDKIYTFHKWWIYLSWGIYYWQRRYNSILYG